MIRSIEDLKNLYLIKKNNQYPRTTHAWFTIFKGWSKQQSADTGMPNRVRVAFTNVGGDEEYGEEGTTLATKGKKCKGPPNK